MHGVLCHEDTGQTVPTICRSLGASARYVSGYVDPGNSHEAASHAWVDVWLGEHCSLAIGRDYLDACPIRGIREGGLIEKLNVSLTVQTFKQ